MKQFVCTGTEGLRLSFRYSAPLLEYLCFNLLWQNVVYNNSAEENRNAMFFPRRWFLFFQALMLLMASCLLITIRAICLLGVGRRVLLSLNLKPFLEKQLAPTMANNCTSAPLLTSCFINYSIFGWIYCNLFYPNLSSFIIDLLSPVSNDSKI
jgi:hypothetical protein